MLRTSHYTLIMPGAHDDERLLVHGYTGAVDVVDLSIVDALVKGKSNSDVFLSLSSDDLSTLKRRGYVTEKDLNEEVLVLKKVADKLSSFEHNRLAVTLIPTYNCNFRCSYCFESQLFNHGSEWLSQSMSNELVDHVMNGIQELRNKGKVITDLWLFGGEPLLKKHYDTIAYIVSRAQQNNLTVRCVSNGYDLLEFESLLGKGKIETIQITVDGIESTHNNRRYMAGGQPTYEKIMHNIHTVLKEHQEVDIIVRSNIDRSNLHEIRAIQKNFVDRGWYQYNNFSNYFKSVHACYSDEVDPLNDVEVMAEINKQTHQQMYEFHSLYHSIEKSFDNLFKTQSYAPFRTAFCGAVSGGVCVDPFGDVYPCWDVIGKKEEVIGRMTKDGFLFNDHYAYWNKRCVQSIKGCETCAYALFCGGGCPAHAKVVNNDAYSPYCNQFQSIFQEVVPSVYRKYLKE